MAETMNDLNPIEVVLIENEKNMWIWATYCLIRLKHCFDESVRNRIVYL